MVRTASRGRDHAPPLQGRRHHEGKRIAEIADAFNVPMAPHTSVPLWHDGGVPRLRLRAQLLVLESMAASTRWSDLCEARSPSSIMDTCTSQSVQGSVSNSTTMSPSRCCGTETPTSTRRHRNAIVLRTLIHAPARAAKITNAAHCTADSDVVPRTEPTAGMNVIASTKTTIPASHRQRSGREEPLFEQRHALLFEVEGENDVTQEPRGPGCRPRTIDRGTQAQRAEVDTEDRHDQPDAVAQDAPPRSTRGSSFCVAGGAP